MRCLGYLMFMLVQVNDTGSCGVETRGRVRERAVTKVLDVAGFSA